MKAIRVHNPGEPDVLRYEDAPDPQMGPGQVLVRVRAAGVNPVDTYIRAISAVDERCAAAVVMDRTSLAPR